jgi:hypothetical protein
MNAAMAPITMAATRIRRLLVRTVLHPVTRFGFEQHAHIGAVAIMFDFTLILAEKKNFRHEFDVEIHGIAKLCSIKVNH